MKRIDDYIRLLFATARSVTAREAAIVMSGNLGSALLRFAVSVVLANHTTKEEFAYFALFIAVMDLSTIAADSGLNNTMVRYVALGREGDLRPLLKQSFLIRAVLWLAVVLIGAAGAWPFFATQGVEQGFGWMYPAAVASGLFISVSGHGMSIMQGLQRFWAFAALALSVNVLRVSAVLLGLALGFASADALFAAFFLVPTLTIPLAMVWVRFVQGRGRAGNGGVPYRDLIRYMAPIGVVSILAIVLQRVDVFLLKALDGPETVADFRVAFELAYIFPLLARSLFTVLLPKASIMTTGDQLAAYRRRVIVLYPALLALVAVAVAIGPWLIELLFGSRYVSSVPVLRVLLIAFGMHIVFNPLSVVLYAIERHILVPAIHLVQLPMLIALDFWLIPRYGGMGAAIGALVIRVFGVAAVLVFTHRAIAAKRIAERESN